MSQRIAAPDHRLPRSLCIGRKRYEVLLVRHTPRRGFMGEINYATRQITVATHSSRTGRKFTRTEVQDTFWHELTHGILFELGSPMYRNEALVSRFAATLTRAVNSARFE